MKRLGDESAQAMLFWVLGMGMLSGFLALAIDMGVLYRASGMVQAAADSASVAGAAEIESANVSAAAQATATQNGYTNNVNGATVTVNNPPLGGLHAGNSRYVEVIITQAQQTFFMGYITRRNTVTVSARAVAATVAGQTCVYALATSGTDISASNDAQFSVPSCGIVADSSNGSAIAVSGSANITATSVGVVGNYSVDNSGSKITPTPVTGISAASDPLAGVPAPTYTASSCTADPLSHYGNGGSSYSVGPGSTYSTTQSGNLVCYNSLTIGSNGDNVTINPGTYVITGALTFNSQPNLGGNGVTFYLVGSGSVNIGNGATINLSAPTSGTYSGILFFQDRADATAAQLEGGASSSMNGALYFPDAALTIGNGSNTTVSAPIVAKTLTLVGGTHFTDTSYANTPITTAKLVE